MSSNVIADALLKKRQLEEEVEQIKKKIKTTDDVLNAEQNVKFRNDLINYQVKKFIHDHKEMQFIQTQFMKNFAYYSMLETPVKSLRKYYEAQLDDAEYLKYVKLYEKLVSSAYDGPIHDAISTGKNTVQIPEDFMNDYELQVLIGIAYNIDVVNILHRGGLAQDGFGFIAWVEIKLGHNVVSFN